MSAEQNKAVVRWFYEEVWNKGNYPVADELIAPDGTRHDHDTSGPNSPTIQKAAAAANRAILDNLRLTVENMVADDEWFSARWRIRGNSSSDGDTNQELHRTEHVARPRWQARRGPEQPR